MSNVEQRQQLIDGLDKNMLLTSKLNSQFSVLYYQYTIVHYALCIVHEAVIWMATQADRWILQSFEMWIFTIVAKAIEQINY